MWVLKEGGRMCLVYVQPSLKRYSDNEKTGTLVSVISRKQDL